VAVYAALCAASCFVINVIKFIASGWIEKVAELKNVHHERGLFAKDERVCQRLSESNFLTNYPRFPKYNYFLEGSHASFFG
jgi:hypothetical protein